MHIRIWLMGVSTFPGWLLLPSNLHPAKDKTTIFQFSFHRSPKGTWRRAVWEGSCLLCTLLYVICARLFLFSIPWSRKHLFPALFWPQVSNVLRLWSKMTLFCQFSIFFVFSLSCGIFFLIFHNFILTSSWTLNNLTSVNGPKKSPLFEGKIFLLQLKMLQLWTIFII